MSVETLQPSGVAAPLGHLSNATRAGRRLYLAGLVALDAEGALVGKDSMREQTLHVCRTIERVCAQHGADLTAVARCLDLHHRPRSLSARWMRRSPRSSAPTGRRGRP